MPLSGHVTHAPFSFHLQTIKVSVMNYYLTDNQPGSGQTSPPEEHLTWMPAAETSLGRWLPAPCAISGWRRCFCLISTIVRVAITSCYNPSEGEQGLMRAISAAHLPWPQAAFLETRTKPIFLFLKAQLLTSAISARL